MVAFGNARRRFDSQAAELAMLDGWRADAVLLPADTPTAAPKPTF